MDFYIDVGFAVLLRLLKDTSKSNEWRPAFLKLYRAIAYAYAHDPDFQDFTPPVKRGG